MVRRAVRNVVPMISGLATRMGIREARMVSVEVIDTPVLAALHDGEALLDTLAEASHRALDRGADVLVLGCTGGCWVSRRPCSPGSSRNG